MVKRGLFLIKHQSITTWNGRIAILGLVWQITRLISTSNFFHIRQARRRDIRPFARTHDRLDCSRPCSWLDSSILKTGTWTLIRCGQVGGRREMFALRRWLDCAQVIVPILEFLQDVGCIVFLINRGIISTIELSSVFAVRFSDNRSSNKPRCLCDQASSWHDQR